jgi:hypothetical protein
MNWFLNNREIIKNFAFNTGTNENPVFTAMCTASELSLNEEFDEQTFYTFCDAIQRTVKTGVALSIEGTIKLDMNNNAIISILDDINTLVSEGSIAQFNNKLIQFDLLTGANNGVLEYTTYQAPVSYSLEAIGGAAEDVAEFAITVNFNGKGTEVASA